MPKRETIANYISIFESVVKNKYMFVEKYFGVGGRIFRFMGEKTITISYPIRLNLDLRKPKHKIINLRVNGDADRQYELMFKRNDRDHKNGR